MATLLGIHFAPLFIPFHRRLETFAVTFHLFNFVALPFVITAIVAYLLFFTKLWFMVLLYGAWLVYDWKTPCKGSRPVKWFKNLCMWRWYADYFPLHLVKTTELEPGRNYVMACHPHGIAGLGILHAFAAAEPARQFPGIDFRVCTLRSQFFFPLRREYFMAFGAIESSKESISYVLNDKRQGNAVVIVVGGAAEALHAFPGSYNIVLSNRKGFVKMALLCGADLVPVISFGENDLYNQIGEKGGHSFLRFIQLKLKNVYTYSLPFFYGRGVFNYNFGLLPFRKPVYTVVGSPIRVEKNAKPSAEQIDDLHARYIQHLVNLFEANKTKYGVDKDTKMNII